MDSTRHLAPPVRLLGAWLLLSSGVSGARMGRMLAEKGISALHDERGSLELMGHLAALATNGGAAIVCLILSRRLRTYRAGTPWKTAGARGHRTLPRPAPLAVAAIVAAALAALQMALFVTALGGGALAGRRVREPFGDLVPTTQTALWTLTLVVIVSGLVLFTDPSSRRRVPWSAVASAGFVAFVGLFVLRAAHPASRASDLPLLPLAADLTSAGLMLLLASLMPMAAEADFARSTAGSALAGYGTTAADSSRRSTRAARRAFRFLRDLTNDVEGLGQKAFTAFAILVLADASFRLVKIWDMDPGLFWPTRRVDASGAVLLALIEASVSLFALRAVGAGVWHLVEDGPDGVTRWTRTLGVGRNVWFGLAAMRSLLLLWSLPENPYERTFVQGAFVAAILLDVAKALLSWRWRAAWARVEDPLHDPLDGGPDAGSA